MITPVKNPWNGIDWNNTIASNDRAFFNQHFVSPNAYAAKVNAKNPKAKLDFNCLPEPFSGDITSNVYCLNMNPGNPDPNFVNDPCFEILTQQNLAHNWQGLFWTDRIKNVKGDIHDGVDWLNKKMAGLVNNLGRTPKMFFIDFFPYHSAHGFAFPTNLPTNDYRDYLVMKAMDEGKTIIVMRQKKRWFNAIQGLDTYPRLITLKCPAGGWLSNGNFIYGPGVTYNDLLKEL